MIGTVVGEYIQDTLQDQLLAYVGSCASKLVDCGYSTPGYKKLPECYGLTVKPDGSVTLDGACGINAMQHIAECLGYSVTSTCNRKGHVIGFFVSRLEV
jgi:hypothetical protein